jgi:hypothetical protein
MGHGSCSGESPAPDGLIALAQDDLAANTADTQDPSNDSGEVSEKDLLAAVETFEGLSNLHTEDPVEYGQVPPVGGDHNPVLQNCDFYDEPVGNEHAVHSLEHGAVWITYDPELPRRDVRALEALVDGHDHVLISPYEGLPAPVVASAWGVQLQLEGVDDPYLQAFIDYYEEGPQTPEPGAPCSGGTSDTVP